MAAAAAAAVATFSASPAPALADDLALLGTDLDQSIPEIVIPGNRSIREQLDDKLTELGEVLDEHLGRLTLDVIDLHYDGHGRRARVRVGGESQLLSMRVDGTVDFEHGLARVNARLHLGIGDQELDVNLPTFELVPRSFAGERWVEMRLPLLTGTF